MTYPVYFFFYLCLILFQTVILPTLFHLPHTYDLFIVFVIYLGFYRSLVESIPVVLILGMTMDCFSGGAFGIYLTTYIWLYAVVKFVIQYFHVDSRILLPVSIVAGVAFENSIVLLTVAMRNSDLGVSFVSVSIALGQMFWALVTGPFIYLILKYVHSGCNSWFQDKFNNEDGHDDVFS